MVERILDVDEAPVRFWAGSCEDLNIFTTFVYYEVLAFSASFFLNAFGCC